MSDEAKPAGAGELDLNAIRGQLNLPEGAGEKEIIGALSVMRWHSLALGGGASRAS